MENYAAKLEMLKVTRKLLTQVERVHHFRHVPMDERLLVLLRRDIERLLELVEDLSIGVIDE